MGNAEPPRSALCLLRPHGFGGEKSIYEYKIHLLIMEIGAVGGIEPPLRHQVSNETANDLTVCHEEESNLPSAPCHRSEYIELSSLLLCKECCSLVGCIHCGVIGSPRSLSTCCIVGADHIRNANSHTRLECLLCATRCGRYACCQYVNVLLPQRGFAGRMGIEPIRCTILP